MSFLQSKSIVFTVLPTCIDHTFTDLNGQKYAAVGGNTGGT